MQMKKLLAGGLAAAMAGSTLAFGAIAQSSTGLGDYVDGSTVPIIVIGSNAGSATEYPKDVAAAGDIAAHVAGFATTEITVPGIETTSITGGAELATTSNSLYIGDYINKARSVLTEKDLPVILESTTFTDETGTGYNYNQYIEIGSAKIQFSKPDSTEDPVVNIDASNTLYTSRIVFNKAIDFTEDNVRGENINLFGNEYMIGYGSDNTRLILFNAGNSNVVAVGDTITIVLAGKEHTIEISSMADSTTAVILVDGKLKEVTEGGTYTFDDELNIFIKGVYFTGSTGTGTSQVEFIIGSEEMELNDGSRVKIGDEQIEGTLVTIYGNNSVSKIDISVQVVDDTENIILGESFIDPVFGTFKTVLHDIIDSNTDNIIIDSAGKSATIKFTDYRNNDKQFTFAYFDGISLQFGDNSGTLITANNVEAKERDYIIIGPDKFSEFTHVFKVTNIDVSDNEFTLEDVMSGESETHANGIFYIDGQEYTADINSTTGFVSFLGINETAFIKAINDEYIRFDTILNQVVVLHEDGIEHIFDITNTTDNVDIEVHNTAGYITLESDTDKEQLMTSYGTLVTFNSDDEGRVEMEYPTEQVIIHVVMGSDPKTVTTATEDIVYETAYHITNPIVKLDNELSEIPIGNIILIGGPCANAVVAELLSVDGVTCDNWAYTTGIIKEIEFSEGQKALIIAGTSASQTRSLAADLISGAKAIGYAN